MAEVSQIICSAVSHNQGRPSCSVEQDFNTALLAVPKGTVLSAASLAAGTIATTIAALLANDTKSLRGYLLKTINITTDVGEAAQTEDRGYAGKGRTFVGSIGRTYQFFKGKRCMYDALLPFDQSQDDFDFFEIDRSNQLWGKKVYDTDGITILGLSGYSANDVSLNNPMVKQVNKSSEIILTIMYENAEEFRTGYGYVANFPAITSLNGLTDVRIVATPVSSGVYDIAAYLPCTDNDALALYGTALAATTAVKGYVASSNAALTTSSVSYVAGIGATFGHLRVTFSTSSPYPTPPALILIKLAAPSVLEGLGAVGIEGKNTISIASN